MSNDTSVFPVALLENAVTGPITYQGEEVRGSPTHANNSANAIVRVAIPADKRRNRKSGNSRIVTSKMPDADGIRGRGRDAS